MLKSVVVGLLCVSMAVSPKVTYTALETASEVSRQAQELVGCVVYGEFADAGRCLEGMAMSVAEGVVAMVEESGF